MRIGVMVAATCVLVAGMQAQRNVTEAAARLHSSVVRIQAYSCQGELMRAATGFVWRDPATVVTAWHVISDCEKVEVAYEAPNRVVNALPTTYSAKADLVLLQIKDAPQEKPMSLRREQVNLGEDLVAIGYASGKPKMDTTSLRLRFGGSILEDIVPPQVRDELAKRNSPSLKLPIANIEGHLVPGLSGAPILDSLGRVVAIGDGGLERGAIASSWGIPISNLFDGQEWKEVTKDVQRRYVASSSLFAFDSGEGEAREISCGGVTLTRVKTRSFKQLVATADNGPLLEQQASQLSMLEPEKMQFDVYEHQPSGATVVLPSGARLQEAPGMCRAEFLDGRVLLDVSLAVERSREATDAKSQMFEGLLLDLAPSEWRADPEATSDVTRFDRLVVHRRGYFKRQEENVPKASSLKGMFETLAARNNVFLGVGLVYNLGIQELMAEAMSCNQRNDCPASLDKIRLWAQAFACVELSTFSVG